MKLVQAHLDILQEDINTKGWCCLPNLLSKEDLALYTTAEELARTVYYNENMLERRVSYISDESESRRSNAIMVSERKNKELPSIHYDEVLGRVIEPFNLILSLFTNEEISPSSRTMINFQTYYSGSKPVRDHFDGEYLDYEMKDAYTLLLKKAILPQFVAVLVLHNENTEDPNGIVLRSLDGETHAPRLDAGDFILFDNIMFRHSVPILNKPRKIIGFRNFDHNPFQFFGTELFKELNLHPIAADGWHPLKDNYNPGYIKSISSEEATKIMAKFNKEEWPSKWKKVKENNEAVF